RPSLVISFRPTSPIATRQLPLGSSTASDICVEPRSFAAMKYCRGVPKSLSSTFLPWDRGGMSARRAPSPERSEEHTSELQSPCNLVCRLLLEKKKKKK